MSPRMVQDSPEKITRFPRYSCRRTEIIARRLRMTALASVPWVTLKLAPEHSSLTTAFHRPHHRLKNLHPIRAPQLRLRGPFRMRHHPHYISSRTANARNIVQRSIGIRRRRSLSVEASVPEHNAILAAQFVQRRRIAEVVPFHVADRNGEHLAFAAGIGEWRVDVFHPQLHQLANVFQPHVAQQRSWQKSRFAKNLEPVADAEHQPAAIRKLANRFHHRRELRDRPGS